MSDGAGALPEPLARVRAWLLDDATLVRAVAAGRRKGQHPPWRRVELRWVDLKGGRHLQVTGYDDTQAHTSNHPRPDAGAVVDGLLGEPFATWHVERTTEVCQVRVTKRGAVSVHTQERARPAAAARAHDRVKDRLLPEDDEVLVRLGLSSADGRLKPSRQAKHRQIEEFLRLLDTTLADALASGRLRTPTPQEPLRLVDLGCGNGYLTFAAHRYLTAVQGLPVHLTGVDVKEQSREHNTRVAAELGIDATFVVGSIESATLPQSPDVVLALHACDTATDEALARAVRWEAPVILAAPCCHHDLASQLRRGPTPAPYDMVTRDGILRERLADTLTDALRASLLRQAGYRVDVVEFVASRHTPRNTLIRAVRTGGAAEADRLRRDYQELVTRWAVRPRLEELLADAHP